MADTWSTITVNEIRPGDYVRLDVNLGWWALVIGRSFKPKDVQDEN